MTNGTTRMIDFEMDAEQAQQEKLAARLEAFSNSLKRKRDEAISGRKNSGIEEEWVLAEESYQGIDDANRGSMAMGKPSSPYGGYVNGKPANKSTRSTVLLNITRPYVDAASARVGDMLLPTDDRNWAIKPTPIAETAKSMMGQLQGVPPEQAQAIIQQVNAQAKVASDGAQTQIEDWLVQCQWHAEVRKLIEDCSRLGTGVLKGPVPAKKRTKVATQIDGAMALVIKESIGPESKSISPWNFFPDPDCGESIHDGGFTWEVDTITAKRIRDLRGLPGYIDVQIDKVLEQGPQSRSTEASHYKQQKARDSDVYEIWYYYGMAEREDLIAAGVDVPEDGDTSVPAILTVINDIVVKGALNPLDSGEFPYDVMPWQRKTDQPWGTGIAVQINTPQRMLTAAVRNMMDNAGLSAGPQMIIRRNAIQPADGQWALTPRKIWWVNDGADVAAVNQAFMAVNIPTLQNELNNIIQLALKMAEDVTGLPMLMQGQAGAATPDTVGGMQMLNNNASSVLRRIARLFDDKVTEPHIRRYYDWLMEYGEDDSIKGDFCIDARGSSALVERDLQNQAILQMGSLVMNPAFGIDPEKWFNEALKAQRLDPLRFTMDKEKKAQMAQQPPPMPPQIQAAQIRAQADMQKAQLMLQADAQKTQALMEAEAQQSQAEMAIKAQIAEAQYAAQVEKMRLDSDRDTIYTQAQTQRDVTNAQAKMAELQIKRELAMLEYALREKLSLETVKAKLASDAMKLQVQKELAGADGKGPQIVTPVVEPAGRAPDGEAFQK